MRHTLFAILFFVSLTSVSAQNVVGMKTEEVKSFFRTSYPDLTLESNINNERYHYLKYSDLNSHLVTVLAFLNEDEHCYAARFIYDLSLEAKVLRELNKKYTETGENTWKDTGKNKEGIVIVYKKEEWFITVNYKEE